MYPLKTEDARELVRKNLDEQNFNVSEMIDLDDMDSDNLDELIDKTLPEAINIVHLAAPAFMLDGKVADDDHLDLEVTGDMLKVTLRDDMLRLVSFKAKESDVIITEADPEDSARARMQLTPYTRASFDRPCLVQLRSKAADLQTSFKYYGLKSYDDTLDRLEYIETYRTQASEYKVAGQLVEKIINQLTGMVLAVLGNTEGAQYFLALASFGDNNK